MAEAKEAKELSIDRMASDRQIGNGMQSAREVERILARNAELAKRAAERESAQVQEEAAKAAKTDAEKRARELREGVLDLGEVRVRLEATGGVVTFLRLPVPLSEDDLAAIAKSASGLADAAVVRAAEKAKQARAEADEAEAKLEAFKNARGPQN